LAKNVIMNILSIIIKGDVACFNKPITNNNPSTFNIITKPALIGMIAASNGLKRTECKDIKFYKNISEELKYTVILKNKFNKGFWNEYAENFQNKIDKIDRILYSPKNSERLYNINYEIKLFYDKNKDINRFINNFIENIKNNNHIYPLYLGMANMFCNIKYLNLEDINDESFNGEFETKGFVTNLIHSDEEDYYEKIIVDNVPTLCLDNFVHSREDYKEIYFHENGGFIKGKGKYYKLNNECYEFV